MKVVRTLLQHESAQKALNARNSQGLTALHTALQLQHLDVFDQLLEAGADTTVRVSLAFVLIGPFYASRAEKKWASPPSCIATHCRHIVICACCRSRTVQTLPRRLVWFLRVIFCVYCRSSTVWEWCTLRLCWG